MLVCSCKTFFSWLTLEMMNLDDYRANLQNCHELGQLNFLWNQFYGLFSTLFFRVVWFAEQLCLSQMVHNFKNWWHMIVNKTTNLPYK